MKILGIIPARYGSTRLEGKPLADIGGKPMIQHVYERANQALHQVLVATDDERIARAVIGFGGKVVLTSHAHNTGTNRCLEAYDSYVNESGYHQEVIINIQGDEPMLDPGDIQMLGASFEHEQVQMATLISPLKTAEELWDDGVVKVVMDQNRDALYFSRSAVPHVRDAEKENWLKHHTFYKHIGMYAYRPKALQHFASLPQSSLELAEALEQNRWLEDGQKIRLEITKHQGISVDTPADLENVRNLMAHK
ncbi:MAG: 3-deoxy-manno-octulosonate cytidylyltransferase [Owenweeksia sp.]|nr:3-deoxy-manno-octulosonate cytidylyltransferase [Owenweeksia sp.]